MKKKTPAQKAYSRIKEHFQAYKTIDLLCQTVKTPTIDSLDTEASIRSFNVAIKNPYKTMTEATNTEVKLHGGATPESVHRFFT